jgi:hypothetical protein
LGCNSRQRIVYSKSFFLWLLSDHTHGPLPPADHRKRSIRSLSGRVFEGPELASTGVETRLLNKNVSDSLATTRDEWHKIQLAQLRPSLRLKAANGVHKFSFLPPHFTHFLILLHRRSEHTLLAPIWCPSRPRRDGALATGLIGSTTPTHAVHGPQDRRAGRTAERAKYQVESSVITHHRSLGELTNEYQNNGRW